MTAPLPAGSEDCALLRVEAAAPTVDAALRAAGAATLLGADGPAAARAGTTRPPAARGRARVVADDRPAGRSLP